MHMNFRENSELWNENRRNMRFRALISMASNDTANLRFKREEIHPALTSGILANPAFDFTTEACQIFPTLKAQILPDPAFNFTRDP